jgi:alpha-galactosidase
MEPLDFEIRYQLADDADGEVQVLQHDLSVMHEARERVDERAVSEDGALGACISFDGEVLEVAVEAHADVLLEPFEITLRHAFATDEAVLINGYQSWTDTTEKPAWSRMRGLRGVSSRIVERYVLDGGGDYAIIDYPAKRGHQHGFTYATFRRGNGMVLVGSLDESMGFTLIRTDASKGVVLLQSGRRARVVAEGEAACLGRYAITRGTMRDCYDRWFELAEIKARSIKPLVGYTSWYRHYGDIDEQKLTADLDGVASFFNVQVPFSLSSVQKVFQIDDGFCKVGDWLRVDGRKFPRGLAPLASRITEAGFLPGLWLAPFVCERDSRLFRERPEWLLLDDEGSPVPTGSQWSGGYALDTRNVEVRSYVLDVLQTVTRDWGFGLLKLDFLYAACKMSHDGLNRGELMADAVDLLRRGVGDDVLLLGCGVPLASAFGKFDYCRIGCDVGLDWDDLPHKRMLHRERISTKNSLANTYARAPLDGRAFGNDPDVFFLRRDVRLTKAQRDELLFADADLGSVFLTSDDMSLWSRESRERYLEALRIVVERHK